MSKLELNLNCTVEVERLAEIDPVCRKNESRSLRALSAQSCVIAIA